jgi:hypothetical protein
MLDRQLTRRSAAHRRHRRRLFGLTTPLNRCRPLQRRALESTTVEMNIFTRITTSEFSPALKVATVLGGIVALFAAMRGGHVLIKLPFGLLALAILSGAAWWFLARQ